MLTSLILFAQNEGDKQGSGPGLFDNPILLLPILFMLFYFVIILPQQRKQRREQDSLMSGLKKNDEVLTASGIIGVVANILPKEGGDEVTLKIDDNARIRILKSSIVRILKKEETKDVAAAPVPATAPAAPTNTNIKPTT